MNTFRILFIVTIISSIIIACGDNTPEPSDKVLPVIVKVNPYITHQSYNFGDTAFFNIKFSDNDKLKEVSLRLYLATDETMLFTNKYPNSDSSSIDTFIVMNDPRFSDLDFQIKAIDASGNVALQSSHIHLR